jgi:hypothetical protein
MTRHPAFAAVLALAAFSGCRAPAEVEIEAGSIKILIDRHGSLESIRSSGAGMELLAANVPAPLLSIRVAGALSPPETATWLPADSMLRLVFPNGTEAGIEIASHATHASFELVSLSDTSGIELVVWGPYPTILNEVIGETVGVVQGRGLAIGLQALNPRTLGGYPWKENDAMPQLDIFEGGDFSDLSEEGKRYVLYRVEAAKPDSFGSTLQAYTRNRSTDRVVPNLGYDRYIAPAFDDGGLVGSRIALFGTPSAEALSAIGAIEVAEGLPHPMLDGVWAKVSPRAAQAYIIMPFGEDTIDEALDVVARAGMQYLYHPDPFSSWGHFLLREDDFPGGIEGLKRVVDRAAARGKRVGAHTLSNFIHPHDAYVSPTPDPRLARVGTGLLAGDIGRTETEIPVHSPDLFVAGERSTLRTTMVGDELIQYESVSTSAPWRLLGAKRGAFGTAASDHVSGSPLAMLADHGYRVFLSNPALSVEMAGNLARIFQETGLRHISFDGLEGNRSTGLGNYGEILFTQSWFDSLDQEAQQSLIVTASRTSHYFWHLYTRMNWGEPWYAGFRESQTDYRMKNQKYFQRNFMPGMLGWFSMRPETSVEDIEWMLARSAAYDAGYAFYTSLSALESNGRSGEILDLLALWERARLTGAFSADQKQRMEDVSGEFHLEERSPDSWTLFPVASYRFTYQQRERQPGEPEMDSYDFENTAHEQGLTFLVTAVDGPTTNPTFSIDGVLTTEVNVTLREGEVLVYRGGDAATVYSPSWESLREVMIEPAGFRVGAGAHRLGFSCDSGSAKIELRLTGDGEPVGVAPCP